MAHIKMQPSGELSPADFRLASCSLAECNTNHTLLPEALEKWPLRWFELLLPRHLEIILEIDRRLREEVLTRWPGDDDRAERACIVERGGGRLVRMAHLAIAGSHSTNGVAEIHSRLLREVTVRDLAEIYPDRFNNKTNGVTPRRWLLSSNPGLADCINKAIGERWITNMAELERLKPLGVIETTDFLRWPLKRSLR